MVSVLWPTLRRSDSWRGADVPLLPAISSPAAPWLARCDCGRRIARVVWLAADASGVALPRYFPPAPALRFAGLARSFARGLVAHLLQRALVPSPHLVLERPMAARRVAKPDRVRGGFGIIALAGRKNAVIRSWNSWVAGWTRFSWKFCRNGATVSADPDRKLSEQIDFGAC